jgi:enoyl-CoA hydratase/carnithine racemase
VSSVRVEHDGPVTVVTIDRPRVRNAVDPATSADLVDAFKAFDADGDRYVAILTGAGGTFCAGFDLKALASGASFLPAKGERSPMGPARLLLGKPVIAAVEGYAVGGGFELALWCDLRVAARDAVFGVFNRRFGVPLVDGGTIRLPRLIGLGRAMDLILTGRGVSGDEALAFGLVSRLAEPGRSLEEALTLAGEVARHPQTTLRNDRLSAYEQWPLPFEEAMANELRRGLASIASGESAAGARGFATGAGRHGRPATDRD